MADVERVELATYQLLEHGLTIGKMAEVSMHHLQVVIASKKTSSGDSFPEN